MNSLNVILKVIPLAVFVGVIGPAHAAFPTPPWSKDVLGRGLSNGPKSSACPKAQRGAETEAAKYSNELKAECEKNKGVSGQGSGGGVCMYTNASGAIYHHFTKVLCSVK